MFKVTTLFILSCLVTPSVFAGWSYESINSSTCSQLGDNPNKAICNVPSSRRGDHVVINDRGDSSVLEIEDKNKNIYYMSLGHQDSRYNVAGNIGILSKNGKAKAIIYRENYVSYDGKHKGFKIITVRLRGALQDRKKTCVMASYDSKTATIVDLKQKEALVERDLRQQAVNFAQSKAFKKECMDEGYVPELADAPEGFVER